MAKPAENLHVNKYKAWNRRVALVGLGLLVILPVSLATFDFRSAPAPSQPQMASTGSGWYLSSGQWRADVRTLAAAFDYVRADTPQHALALLAQHGDEELIVFGCESFMERV